MSRPSSLLPPIDSLIPHRPPFRFVDRVVRLAEDGGEFELHLDTGDRRLNGDRLDPLFLVEALAQSAAAFHGATQNAAPGRGMLVDVSGSRFYAAARAGETVLLRIERERVFGNLVRFVGSARCGERLLAETRLTVQRQPNTAA